MEESTGVNEESGAMTPWVKACRTQDGGAVRMREDYTGIPREERCAMTR
jgi:hypothetical protein